MPGMASPFRPPEHKETTYDHVTIPHKRGRRQACQLGGTVSRHEVGHVVEGDARRCAPTRVEQNGIKLAFPAKYHICVQPLLQRQLGYRYRLIARLFRQLPLELRWMVRAAPALPWF